MSSKLAVLCCLVFACSATQVLSTAVRQDAKLAQYPYYVSLYMTKLDGIDFPVPQLICSGTILNEEWILTAARCILERKADSLMVKAGNIYVTNKTESEQYSNVIATFVPPNHDKTFGSNNIGLIKLKNQLKFNKYVAPFNNLADSETPILGNATLIDLGYLDNLEKNQTDLKNQMDPEVLQTALLPLISHEECEKLVYQHFTTISPEKTPQTFDNRTICTRLTEKNQERCLNDAGGPLLIDYKGKEILIGVASYGLNIKCEKSGSPLYCVILHTPVMPFVKWIYQTMYMNTDLDL